MRQWDQKGSSPLPKILTGLFAFLITPELTWANESWYANGIINNSENAAIMIGSFTKFRLFWAYLMFDRFYNEKIK